MLKTFYKRFGVWLLIMFFVFSTIFIIKPDLSKALIVTDFTNLAVNIKDAAWKITEKAYKSLSEVFWKNGVRYFLNQLAYNAATSLVEGGTGKTSLFPKFMVGDMLQQAAGDALGEFIDTVAKDGLGGFDICNPASIKTTLDITLPAFQEMNPGSWDAKGAGYKAKCSWQDIRKRWTDFKEAAYADPQKYLASISLQFKEGANDLSISAQVRSRLLSNKAEKETNAKIETIANQYFNPVVAPISKFIKTPASVVKDTFQDAANKATVPETTPTDNPIASAIGIFTNTLAAKLQQKIMDGLRDNSLPQSRVTLNQINVVNTGLKFGGNDPFANFKKVTLIRNDSGDTDLFERFSLARLSMQGDNSLNKGPGYTSEVLPDSFLLAARQELTVQQAINGGIINPNIQVGFKEKNLITGPLPENYVDVNLENDDGKWPNDLSYRSLVISRIHRVLPQSWELAALFWRYYDKTNNTSLTLNKLINCYADTRTGLSPYGTPYNEDPRYPEDCRIDMNGNDSKDDLNPLVDYNPYFHLVDPNWVLRLPANKCLIKGSGPEIIYQSVMCSEDNVDAGQNSRPGGDLTSAPISRGEGTPICDEDQAEKLGITNTDIQYDIPTRTISRDSNYCADWQTCINENDSGACQAYGYCVEEKSVTKLNADSCAYPLGTDSGLYSSCDDFEIAGKNYSLVENTLQKCSANDAGCKRYSTQKSISSNGEYSWSFLNKNSSVYFNDQVKGCDENNKGCTKVAEYKIGTNLLYNSDFTSGDYDGEVFNPTGWTIPEEVDNTLCSFVVNNQGERTATLHSETRENCLVRSENPALISPGYTYSLSYELVSEGESDIMFIVTGVNSAGEVIKTATISATSSSNWLKISKTINIANDNQDWDFPLETVGIYLKFAPGETLGKVNIRNLNFTIINGPLVNISKTNNLQNSSTQNDYTRSNLLSYKIPPDYLKCNLYYEKLNNYNNPDACVASGGVWNGSLNICVVGGGEDCENYVPLCYQQDVGCQMFKAEDGSMDVPAKVSGDDICPSQCVGYNSYSRQPSYFESSEFPLLYSTASSCQNAGGYWENGIQSCQAQPTFINLIPSSSRQCMAEAVGCQSFTNLEYASKGGEQQEYFSFLRPCINVSATSTSKIFYTWEGSDTSGYQLKKWIRLMSNNGFGPCTNVNADTGACLDTGDPNVWKTGSNSGNKAVCSEGDLLNNPDCRDFFDINDKHFYILESKTVVAKDSSLGESCASYRNDATGKVYNADLADAVRCNASNVGCRMFKGGTSNTVTTIVEDDFETGRFDGWENDAGNITGLSISNESLRQGGRSLAVSQATKKIVFRNFMESIKNNKEYTLVFLAKKINTTTGISGNVNDGDELSFTFEGNLQPDWREYRVGPIVANNVSENAFSLRVNNLSPTEGYLIDEIRLIEGRDVYYLIDKSWTIPVSCDNQINNAEGCDANGENCGERRAVGAQMGCSYYLDKNERKVAIKSFTQLCSPSAVNCQAFINTYNSENPGSIEKTNICDSTNGVLKNGSCIINGVAVCQTTGNSNSCQYSNASVPADKLVYFAPDSAYSCNPSYAGCMELGKPKYDLTIIPAPIDEFETVYLINDPDKYDDILCSANGLLCEAMVSKNGGSGVYVSPIGSSDNTSRLCIFDEARNRWVNKYNPDNDCETENSVPVSQRTAYLTPYGNPNYRGWVGECKNEFVGCKEFRYPEKPVAQGINWCDASLNASDYGRCDTTNGDDLITNSFGRYCQKKFSGVKHIVCQLVEGQTTCNYTTNSDWLCFAREKMVNGLDQDIACQVDGKDVCMIRSNNNGVENDSFCTYSVLCKSAYALERTVNRNKCTLVDRGAGCAPFYDVAQPTVSSSAQATRDKGILVTCNPSAKPGDEKYCNTNVILENRLTRQCSEWLYCTSGAIVDGKQVCYDVGRCTEADPNNPNNCKKPSVKTNVVPANQTIDFKNSFEREKIRNLTGYSRVGIRWTNDKVIEGYLAPESMSQTNSYTKLTNGDFEMITANPAKIKGWKLSGYNCGALSDNIFDPDDSWDGSYSLKLAVNSNILNDSASCTLESNSGKDFDQKQNNYLSLSFNSRYVVSLAARSSTGKQVITFGMEFYDKDFNECAIDNIKYMTTSLNVRQKYTKIGGGNSDLYYNRFCIDQSGNQTLPANQVPDWIKGYAGQSYFVTKDWKKYSFVIEANDNLKMPKNVGYGRIIVIAPNLEKGLINGNDGELGTVWIDNVNMDSSLQISSGRYATIMCRLYPSSEAKQCLYTKFDKTYQGLEGYCLEEDPYVPGQCLQWFPVEVAGADSLYRSGEAVQGYDNRPSLYMCVASKGNNDRYYLSSSNRGNHFLDAHALTYTFQAKNINLFPDIPKDISLEDIEEIEINLVKSQDCQKCGDDWNLFFDKSLKLVKSSFDQQSGMSWWYGGVYGITQTGGAVFKDVNSNQGSFYGSYESMLQATLGDDRNPNTQCNIDDQILSGCNRVLVGFEFDNTTKYLSKMILHINDGSDDNGGVRLTNVTIKLKESCDLIAQVVNEYGDNKVNQLNYNNSTAVYGTSTDKLPFLKNTPTSPFASINLDSQINTTPDQWPEFYVPFNFANNVSAMPLSTLRALSFPDYYTSYVGICQKIKDGNDASYLGGTCEGEKVKTKTKPVKNICDLCVGLGLRKFNSLGGVSYITSERCDTIDPNSPDYSACMPVKGLYYPVTNPNTDGVYKTGVERLKKLFAKVFKWYRLEINEQGKPVYVETPTTAVTGLYSDISNQGSPGKVGKIMIGNTIDNNVVIDAPGSSKLVTFKVDIPDAQLPIKKIVIDWGDGSNPTEFYGQFNERHGNAEPFTFNHWYGCVPTADGSRCRLCNNGSTSQNGACQYPGPKVMIQDNWDWCAGSESQPAGTVTTKYGSACSSQPESDDFVNFGGNIIVKPR